MPEKGEFLTRLTSLEERTSKSGNRMLTGTFEVIKKVGTDGEFKGSKVFKHYVVEDAKAIEENREQPKYVEYNINALNSYLKAIGIDNGLESLGNDIAAINDDHLEIPFIAKLDTVENTHPNAEKRAQYPLNFEIRGYARR